MSDDIVERLRYVALPDQGGRYGPWSELARVAANEIEQLRKEIAGRASPALIERE